MLVEISFVQEILGLCVRSPRRDCTYWHCQKSLCFHFNISHPYTNQILEHGNPQSQIYLLLSVCVCVLSSFGCKVKRLHSCLFTKNLSSKCVCRRNKNAPLDCGWDFKIAIDLLLLRIGRLLLAPPFFFLKAAVTFFTKCCVSQRILVWAAL